MPRNVDPGSIKVGKGLAPEGTVEDNSLRYPERDVDPLRVHLHDPSRAHMASSIGIVDEGDCYVSDEVEGALQEICGGASAGRLNGLVSGGTFNELGNIANGTGSVATTSLTLENPTEIMVGAGVYDASGLVADLSGLGAGTYYVYFDTDSASPTFRTLVVSGTAPEVETGAGIEDVLLAKFVYDAGGNVTFWQDGRFFVRNLDRKVQYSSRQGENVDAWSEGCFATLEAFFLWMSEYGEGGTSEEEKGEVLIRGEHEISTTLIVPTDHLQFVGDGNAILSTPAGGFSGANPWLVDISGRSNILFRNITFKNNTPVTTMKAIVAANSQSQKRIRIEDCVFDGGAVAWGVCVDLAVSVTNGGSSVYISGCQMVCGSTLSERAVAVEGFTEVYLTDNLLQGGGASPTGPIGFIVGENDVVGSSFVRVSGCTFLNMRVGMTFKDTFNVRVDRCSVRACGEGIVAGSNLVQDCVQYSIVDNTFDLDPVIGFTAVGFTSIVDARIEGNTCLCSRVDFGGASPRAVSLDASQEIRVTGNFIEGFYDEAAAYTPATSPLSFGYGIRITGGSTLTLATRDVVVSGNTLRKCGVLLTGAIVEFAVGSNTLDGFLGENSGVAKSAAIQVFSGNTASPPTDGVISDNTITRFGGGVQVEGIAASMIEDVSVSDNILSQIAFSQDSRADTFREFGTKGIGFDFAVRCSAQNNSIRSMGLVRDNTGTKLAFPNDIHPTAIYIRNSSWVTAQDNEVDGVYAQGAGNAEGIYVTGGFLGSAVPVSHVQLVNNHIHHEDNGRTPSAGIRFNAGDGSDKVSFSSVRVVDNTIDSRALSMKGAIVFSGTEIASGNDLGASMSGVEIKNNIVSDFVEVGVGFLCSSTLPNGVYAPEIKGIRVVGNRITGSTVPGTSQSGVLFSGSYTDAALGNSDLSGVSVSENHIVADTNGVRFDVSIPAGVTGEVNNLYVTDNVIPTLYGTTVPAGSAGVGYSISGTVSGDVGALVTTGNQICLDSSGASSIHGIALFGNNHNSYSNIVIEGNKATSRSERIYLTFGEAGSSGGSVSGLKVANNDVTSTPGYFYGSAVDGISITCENTPVSSVVIESNRSNATASIAGIGSGIYFRANNSFGDPVSVSYLHITDNFVGGRITVDHDNYGLEGERIVGNRCNGTFSVSTTCLSVSCTATVVGSNAAIQDLLVKDNYVKDGRTGISVAIEDFHTVSGIEVENNTVSDMNTGGALSGGSGIALTLTTTSNIIPKVDSISISRNRVSLGDGGILARGIYASIAPESGTSGLRLSGLQVSDNQITGRMNASFTIGSPNYAIEVDLNSSNSFVLPTFIEGVSVDRNEVSGVYRDSAGHPVYCPRGIGVNGPLLTNGRDLTNGYTLEVHDFSVSDNKVAVGGLQGGAANQTISGIVVKFQDNDFLAGRLPYQIRDLRVDRNMVDVHTCSDEGEITYDTVVGLVAEVTVQADGLSISENRVIESPEKSETSGVSYPRVNDYGIRLFHSFLSGDGEDDFDLPGRFAVGQSLLGGNMERKTGANAWSDFAAVSWQNVRVCDNNIQFCAGEATSDSYKDSRAAITIESQIFEANTYAVAVCLWGLNFSGNNVRSGKLSPFRQTPFVDQYTTVGFYTRVYSFALRWKGSSVTSSHADVICNAWSVTGNNVSDFCMQDTSSGLFYGFDVICDPRGGLGANFNWQTSIVDGNYAQDLGHYQNGIGDNGFDRLNTTSAASPYNLNITAVPRTNP